MMDKYIKTDVEGLVKDRFSGAILNTDERKLSLYKQQKKNIAEQKFNMQKIVKLETDIQELQNIVRELLQKQS